MARWLLLASERLYRLLLLAYPAEFRRDYDRHMMQVFRDCCRVAWRQHGTIGLIRLWFSTLHDLAITIPVEHFAVIRRRLRRRRHMRRCDLRRIVRLAIRRSIQGSRSMLHITNGDSTARSIEQTGLPGTVLPWQDVLHEGPTPAGLSFDQMSKLRARFITDHGWGSYEDILADFLRRDSALEQFQSHKEVVLWFEHDLYDQLQLIQLLHWFSHHDLGTTTLSLICIGEFPGLDNFNGLGELSPAQLRPLYDTRTAVTLEQLALGSAAWQAYCAPEPTAIETFLSRDTSVLPFLRAALVRHLEQFPAVESGLSRTEQQILEVVAAGSQKPAEIFLAAQEKEASAFMGDGWLWDYIAALCDTPDPLLRRDDGGRFTLPSEHNHPEAFLAQALVLTERGRAVLAGQSDRIRDGIDRWLGGVHLHGRDAGWRWDRQQRRIVRWGQS